MQLTHKVVWITGATSGIGEAMFKACCDEKARLIISGRNADKLRLLQTEARTKGLECAVFPFELTDPEGIAKSCQEVLRQFDRIDVLVHNGGVSQRALVTEAPIALDRHIMETNFFGAVAITKAILPRMVAQGGGKLVVISSIVGKFGFPLRSAYAASKHALQGFFDSLRAEMVRENVSVLMVCPGKIATNISKNALTKDGTAYNISDKGHINGMTADRCAQIIVKAIRKEKKEIFVGGKEVLMVYIKRFIPGLFFKIVSKVNPT
ncbi:MAG: SDR family oxidoreductase [Bacteroidales bacterium]|nr:SDR family oxidoreductase [Bacteroidales bacterium]